MPRTSRACWRTSLAGAATALALALGTGAVDAQPQADAAPAPAHVTQARLFTEPGAAWEPPAQLPAALFMEKGLPVELPHARARAVAAAAETVNAPPDVVWYRLDLPPQVRDEAGRHAVPLFLYLPRWQTIGTVAVYAGDRLLWRSTGSRVWNSFNRPLWIPLSLEAAEAPPSSVWIRMASQQGVGGAVSTGWIGAQDDLLWRWRVRSWLQVDLVALTSGAYVVIGLFSLAVWLVRRSEPLYALFFFGSIAHALRNALYVMDNQAPWVPDPWFSWVAVNSLSWTTTCVFLFALQVHRRRMPWLTAGIAAFVLLASLATLPIAPLTPHLSAVLPAAYMVTGLLVLVVACTGLLASWRARSREGLVLFAVFSLYLPVGIHDLLLQNYRLDIERIYLGPYTAIAIFSLFLAIVWRRYVGAIREVEAANTRLENRVAAREAELTASHQQLRALERDRALAAERQRLMQDMHDGIGSSLISALRMVERGQATPQDTAQVLKDCIDDLKLAIDSLEPTDADLLALLAAVRFRLAPRLRAAGITLTWSVQDLPRLAWLDPQKALHVLRIVQEVLTNVLKHSRAETIDLATAHEGDEVLVRIRNDGDGFAGAAQGTGMGLANVRQRSQALGARCQWAARDGGGEFCLWLPLQPAT